MKTKIMDITIVEGQREYYCAPSCHRCCASGFSGTASSIPHIHPAEAFEISQALKLPIKEFIDTRSFELDEFNIKFENRQCYFVDLNKGCKLHDVAKPTLCSLFPYQLVIDFFSSDDEIVVKAKRLDIDFDRCKDVGEKLQLNDETIRRCAEIGVKNMAVLDRGEYIKIIGYLQKGGYKRCYRDGKSKSPLAKKFDELVSRGLLTVSDNSVGGFTDEVLNEVYESMAKIKYELVQSLTLEAAVKLYRKRETLRPGGHTSDFYLPLLEDRLDVLLG